MFRSSVRRNWAVSTDDQTSSKVHSVGPLSVRKVSHVTHLEDREARSVVFVRVGEDWHFVSFLDVVSLTQSGSLCACACAFSF